MFATVAIVGVGLIGGSLGMALRRRGLARRVIGLPRRQATIDEALAAGAIDAGSLDAAVAADADLLVLASPVRTYAPLMRRLEPHLRPGALVTDVGSTKAEITASVTALLPAEVDFVGGHPMAGSERAGVLAGSPDLFEGAVWVLTRAPCTRPESVERLAALVRRLGATPIEMDPALHDEAVARISHLPHVAAAALAEAAASGGVPADVLRLLLAGGFRSTTRIAHSPPEMWRDICLTNREAVLAALDAFQAALHRFRAALEGADEAAVTDAFARGKRARDLLAPPDAPGGTP
jgi:prephenate dehydrogenase